VRDSKSCERGKRYYASVWGLEREKKTRKKCRIDVRVYCVSVREREREREQEKNAELMCAYIVCVCVCMRERDLWTCECALLCSDYNGRYVHLIFVSITWNVFIPARRKNAASSIKVRYFFLSLFRRCTIIVCQERIESTELYPPMRYYRGS
jgi:hypothetical protein